MAADIQEPAFSQQSIVQSCPKLSAGTEVEVRSVEEGFQGSWHSGTVVCCSNHVHVVEYHNLLGDNSEKLVEGVEVSDDNIPTNWRSSTNYRGLIRPLPPSVDIDQWHLPFGLCVDVFHNDVWWEGVIFDHNDGSEERLVFFPDIGDDLEAHFEELRVTQDWDEITEDWNLRGNWVFLELIEEIKQKWPLLVSVKQIWYELRTKKGFGNLKEWTCRMKSIWKELVLGVISDNFNLTLKDFFHRINSSGMLEQERLPLLELTEVALDLMIKPSCDSADEPIGLNETNVEPIEEEIQHDGLGPSGFSEVLSNSDNLLRIGYTTTNSFGDLTQSKCILKNEWHPADIAAEQCPNSITEFNMQYSCGRPSKELVLKVRQHLSYMGWKIEFKKKPRASHKFRYTSPSGKTYFSLHKLCGELTETSFEMIPSDDCLNNEWLPADTEAEHCPNSITEFNRQYSCGSPSEELVLKVRQHLSYMGWKIEFMKDTQSRRFRYISPSGKTCFSLHKLCEELTEASFEMIPSDDRINNEWLPAETEAEHCPNAITEFNMQNSCGRSSNELVLKVRQHLSYMGWKIEFMKEKQSRRFRYTSPSGTTYFSLHKLCRELTEVSLAMIPSDVCIKEWLPADIEAEYFPDTITEFNRQYSIGRPSIELILKVRNHLSYMGWKIEFRKCNRDSNRFRYTSPSGKMYFSLHKLCGELTEASLEMIPPDDRIKNVWLPSDTAAEYCPDVITEYKKQYSCGRPSMKLIPKVRQHLLYMGWKIESMKDYNDSTKWCYTSPSGKRFYSLPTLCGELTEASCEMTPSDVQRSLVSEKMQVCKKPCPDSSLSDANAMGPEYCSQDVKGLSHLHSDADALFSGHSNDKDKRLLTSMKFCEDWNVFSSGINPQPSIDAAPTDGLGSSTFSGEQQQCKKRRLEPSLSDPAIVEPEYSLEAVEDYYRLYKSKENTDFRKFKRGVALQQMQLNVKKHLAAVNWSVFYTGSEERKVLKYSSPSGKSCYSLVGACKIFLKEAGIADAYAPRRRRRKVNVSRENESQGQLAIERQCSPMTESSGLSRELAEMGTTKEVGVRKLRFKRNNGVFSLETNGFRFQREKTNSFSALENQRNELGTGGNSSGRVLRSSKRAREVANLTSLHQAPRTILSWLIENNVVLPRAKVLYRSRTDGSTVAEGRVTRDGIKCNCCQSCFSLSNFEAHAGSTGQHPSANIFLEDGRSLLDCQIQLRRDIIVNRSRSEPCGPRRLKVSKNDYICSVCHFGGELILCDQCPSSFHTRCLGLKEVPDGDWFCPSCCCGICGQSRFNKSTEQFTDRSGVICEQCQRHYHVGCLKEKRHAKLESSPKENWFCNSRCEEIFLGLHRLLGKPVPIGMNNLTWTLLKYTIPDSSDYCSSYDTEAVEIYSKLNVALSVMHECFEPVKEPSTKRDLVEDVIFCRWSELNRLNFQGFYMILLEREDELISVATVRIYGDKVAEVPLVATRFQYRRLGMCRVLINELEKKLVDLGVERLVLPAVPSVLNTWTTSFGFSVMKKLERLNFLDYTFLNFQGTFMCQKILKGPSQELKGTRLKLCDSANGTDGSSAVSEVLQPERIEENGILDQGSLDMAPSGCKEGVTDTSLDIMVDQSTRTKCQTVISMDCLVEATYSNEGENNEYNNNGNSANFKCYKRRKLAAACGYTENSFYK